VRAPTPSAAAELLSPHQDAWRRHLADGIAKLQSRMTRRLLDWQQRLQRAGKRLQHPGRRLQQQSQRLDELETRLRRGLRNRLQRHAGRLHLLRQQLASQAPDKRLSLLRQRLGNGNQRLRRAWRNRLQRLQAQLQGQARALNTVSPLATLGRGYSITSTADGSILRSYEQVYSGVTIHTRLASGSVTSVVQSAMPGANPDTGSGD
jgi:exodeoxyribonuclease VII large subunit